MYVSNTLSEEDKKRQQALGAGVNTSGIIGATTNPGAITGGAAPAQQKDPGTGYVNLQQYLDMNKGAGEELAKTATADATQAANQFSYSAQNTIDQNKDKFNAAAGTDKASGIKSGIVQDADVNKQAAIDFLGAGYAGPKAGDYTAGLAADRNRVQSDLGSVDDVNQQQANLQKAYGKTGNYTQGYGLLDTFLLRGDESGQKKIAEVQRRAQDVGKTYDSAAAGLTEAEKIAREGLERNKAGVLETALREKGNIEAAALKKADEMNKPFINATDREGFQKASLGDGLDDEKAADLLALREIAKLGNDDFTKTFNAGNAKPVPNAAVVPEDPQNPNVTDTLKEIGGKLLPPGTSRNNTNKIGDKIIDGFETVGDMGKVIGGGRDLYSDVKDLFNTPSMGNLSNTWNHQIGDRTSAAGRLSQDALRTTGKAAKDTIEETDRLVNRTIEAGAKAGRDLNSEANRAAKKAGIAKVKAPKVKAPEIKVPKLKAPKIKIKKRW